VASPTFLEKIYIIVMAGLDPGIHVFTTSKKVVDGRVKPGHDGGEAVWTTAKLGRGACPPCRALPPVQSFRQQDTK
jgi:hypothetical protein